MALCIEARLAFKERFLWREKAAIRSAIARGYDEMTSLRSLWRASPASTILAKIGRTSGLFYLLMTGRVVEGLASLVQLRLLTEMLTPREVGRYNLFLSIYMLFSLVFVAPIGSFLMRQLREWSSRQFRREMFLFSTYLVLGAILCGGCYLVWVAMSGGALFMSPVWLFGLLVLFSCVSFQQVSGSFINIIGFSHYYVPLSALGIILGTFLAVAGGLLKPNAEFWALGFGSGYALALVATFFALSRLHGRIALPESSSEGKGLLALQAWSHAGFVMVATTCTWLQTAGYRFLLERDVGLAALGYFVAAYSVGVLPLSLVAKICNDYLQPELFRRSDESLGDSPSRLGYIIPEYVNVILVSVVIFAALVPVNGRILTAVEFWPYLWLALWGVVNQGVFALYTICTSLAQAKLQTGKLVAATIISSIALIASLVPATRVMGLNGIGAAILLALLINLIFTAFSVRSLVTVKIHWSKLRKGLALAACSGVILFGLSALLGPVSLISGGILIGVGGLLWLGSATLCLR
jgi:O-antigen/teichoic acid export membrane protein